MIQIAKYRRVAGLTQKQLGEKIGIKQSTLSQWENGERKPSIDDLQILSESLNVSIEELLGLDEPAQQNKLNYGKLKIYRKRANLTLDDVSTALSVSLSEIQSWESGKSVPSSDKLEALASLYNVSSQDFYQSDEQSGWKTPREKPVPKFTDNTFFVPIVASLRCGFGNGGERFFDVIKDIELPASYRTRYGDDIVIIKATGKSMLPDIRPRDMLICKPGDAWVDGSVVAVHIEDDDSETIKMIKRSPDGGIDLIPKNPEVKTQHFSPEDLQNYGVHVLGRIVRNFGQDL